MSAATTTNFTLYGADISPFAQRVALQLEFKQIEFNLVAPPEGLKSDAFRAINPIGKIPVLEHAGLVFPESEVICEYLEELFPKPPLLPEEGVDRAKCRLISRICDLYVMNPMLPLFSNLSRKTRDPAVVDTALAAIGKGLDALDHWIAADRFASAGRLTLTDFAVAPILCYVAQYAPIFGMDDPFEGRDKVRTYFDKCREDAHVDRGLTRIEAGWQALRALTQPARYRQVD